MVQSWQAEPGRLGGGAVLGTVLGTALGKGLTELLVVSALGLCGVLGQLKLPFLMEAVSHSLSVDGLWLFTGL